MSTKTILSLILCSTLGLAVVGNLFAGNLLLGAGLVLAVLGVGILSHIAFFEEKKKKRSHGVGPIAWINLAMSYGCLLLSLGAFLFLLINPSDSSEMTISKAGQSAGQETGVLRFQSAMKPMLLLVGKEPGLEIVEVEKDLMLWEVQTRIIKMLCEKHRF